MRIALELPSSGVSLIQHKPLQQSRGLRRNIADHVFNRALGHIHCVLLGQMQIQSEDWGRLLMQPQSQYAPNSLTRTENPAGNEMINLIYNDGGLIGFFEHILVAVLGNLQVGHDFQIHMATIAEQQESIVRHNPFVGYDVSLDNSGVTLAASVQWKLIVANNSGLLACF
jgi:hypothetical protein